MFAQVKMPEDGERFFFFFEASGPLASSSPALKYVSCGKRKEVELSPSSKSSFAPRTFPAHTHACAHTRSNVRCWRRRSAASLASPGMGLAPGLQERGDVSERASERERKRHVFFHNHALPHPFLKRKKLAPHPSSPTCAGSTPPSWPPPSSPRAGRGPTAPAVWVHPFPRRSFFCSRLPSASRRLPATLPPFTTRPPRARLPGWACWWARPRHRARRWDPSSAAPPW